MGANSEHPAVTRLSGSESVAGALRVLGAELNGTDLRTLLLAVAEQRSRERTSADVLRQYSADRFARPSTASPLVLKALELSALRSAVGFEPVTCSTMAPLGTSSVLAGVSQNRVVTTMRLTEVTSDSTNLLVLEAAARRRIALSADPRSNERIRLSAADRVTRAQTLEGPRSFAHFSLLGLVSVGRDEGSHDFEIAELARHVGVSISLCRAIGLSDLHVHVTWFDGDSDELARRLSEVTPPATIEADPHRSLGRGYYNGPCFKVHAQWRGEEVELGDGGSVDWTKSLLASDKERCVISGLGLERIATLEGIGDGLDS